MKLVSWNVNSVRARQDRLLQWLRTHQPEVLCLQELKCTEDKFPYAPLAELGYHAAVYGQPTYNGVAIVSRKEPTDVVQGMCDDIEDSQARLIAATVYGMRIICAYVPNGGDILAERYQYKLRWLERLRAYLNTQATATTPLVLCGDFNVAPEDKDVAHPEEWKDSVLCHPEVRQAYRHVCDWGLHDTLRKHSHEGGLYSWWDYRQLAFPKNNGLRIDLILASPPLLDACTHSEIDRQERKGKSPSDHAPVIAEFSHA